MHRATGERRDNQQTVPPHADGVRFIVDLEAGKPTVRLDSVMRVLSALGGVINLDGLPSSAN